MAHGTDVLVWVQWFVEEKATLLSAARRHLGSSAWIVQGTMPLVEMLLTVIMRRWRPENETAAVATALFDYGQYYCTVLYKRQ